MAIKDKRTMRKPVSSRPAVPAVPPDGQASGELGERIARKAYELWEQRGRPDGRDLENWLDAEAIVMDEAHEARE